MSGAGLDWLWWAAGGLLGAAGAALLAWALWWDRARGRRRCPKCWYEMAGVPGLRCPECGREAKSERKLGRTRRRWGWVVPAVGVLIVCYPAAHVPRILQYGWVGAVPTTAAIYWVGWFEPPEVFNNGSMSPASALAAELARRAAAGGFWGWQYRLLIQRLHLIGWRETWPRGVPWRVSQQVPSWLRQAGCKVEMTLPAELWHPRIYPADETARDTDVSSFGWPVPTQPLDPSARIVTLSVTIANWSGQIGLPVRQVDRIEDAMEPVIGAELDRAIGSALYVSVYRDDNPSTGDSHMLGARLYRERGPLPQDLAVAVEVEFCRDGSAVKAWRFELRDSPFGEPVDWARIRPPVPGWDEANPADLARWTVRVRGDTAGALGDFKRDKCWGGTITVPLAEILNPKSEP